MLNLIYYVKIKEKIMAINYYFLTKSESNMITKHEEYQRNQIKKLKT